MSQLWLEIVVAVLIACGLLWAFLSATGRHVPILQISAALGLIGALIWAVLSLSYVGLFGLTATDLSHRPEYRIEYPGARLEHESSIGAIWSLFGVVPGQLDREYRTSASGTDVVAFYRGELRSRGWFILGPDSAEFANTIQMCARGLGLSVFALNPGAFSVLFNSVQSPYPLGCTQGAPLPPEAVALVAVGSFIAYITAASLFQRRARRSRGDSLRLAGGVARWGPAFAWVPYLVLDTRPGPTIEPSEATVAVGLALVILGAAFAWWAASTLGPEFDLEPEVHERHSVVRGGPYRLVRHPVYVGIAVHLFGACVAAGNLVLFVGVLFVGFPLLYLRARTEEQLLRDELGSAYETYRRDVGMFLPRLPRRRVQNGIG